MIQISLEIFFYAREWNFLKSSTEKWHWAAVCFITCYEWRNTKRVIARLWTADRSPQERWRQLPLKSRVVDGLLPSLCFMTSQLPACLHCLYSQDTLELFTCTLSRVLTPVTQFHCTATTACIISDRNWWWQATSVHFSDAAWSEYSTWL